MKKRSTMRVFSLLLLVLLPLLGDHDKRFEIREAQQEHIPKNLQALALTPTQHQQLKTILLEHRRQLMALHQEEEALEALLKRLFQSKEFDKEAFLAQKESLKLKMAKIETNFFVQLHGLFTMKQRAVFAQYIEEWEVE